MLVCCALSSAQESCRLGRHCGDRAICEHRARSDCTSTFTRCERAQRAAGRFCGPSPHAAACCARPSDLRSPCTQLTALRSHPVLCTSAPLRSARTLSLRNRSPTSRAACAHGVHPARCIALAWARSTGDRRRWPVRLRLRCIRVMSSARPCKICGASFASGNKLQQHLKSSSCSRANGAADSSAAPSGSSHASAAAAPAAPSPGPPADAPQRQPRRTTCSCCCRAACKHGRTLAQHAAWLQRAAELPAVSSSGSAAGVPQLLSLGLPILQHLLLYGRERSGSRAGEEEEAAQGHPTCGERGRIPARRRQRSAQQHRQRTR